MATFIDLKTDVMTLLIDTPTAIQEMTGSFVNRAIRRLQRKHDFKFTEATLTLNTTASTRVLGSRPDDWMKARGQPYFIEQMGNVQPMYMISQRLDGLAQYGDNPEFDYGEPALLFEDDSTSNFEVFPYPDAMSDYTDGEYRIVIPYWKTIPPLSADTDENWFTNNAENYITYRATAYGFYANEDESRGDLWFRRAEEELQDILLQDKKRRWADTQTLVPHFGALPPHTQE